MYGYQTEPDDTFTRPEIFCLTLIVLGVTAAIYGFWNVTAAAYFLCSFSITFTFSRVRAARKRREWQQRLLLLEIDRH